MSETTLATLERVSELLSNDERCVSPMQVGDLLEEEAAEGLLAELIEH